MSEPQDQNKEENVESEENELDEANGELLPDREAMSIIDPGDGTYGLSPPAE